MSSKKLPPTEDITGSDRLSLKHRDFVREYLIDYNGTQAAIRAGYSPTSAGETACLILKDPKIKELVARLQAEAASAAQVSAQFVISELHQLATADPRDLVSVHRGACRWCFGINHDRQWTPGEYLDAWYVAKALDPKAPAPPFRGGTAYDFTKPANPDCPECRGMGEERVFVRDTRTLSRGAAKLIAGVKQTKDGIELKSRDQDGALMALGKITGVIKNQTELSGPGGGPLQLQPVPNYAAMTDEDLRAALARSGGLPLLLEATNTAQGDDNEP